MKDDPIWEKCLTGIKRYKEFLKLYEEWHGEICQAGMMK